MSAKIERAARQLAVKTGVSVSESAGSLIPVIRSLADAGQLSIKDQEALILFNRVRKQMIHGREADDDEVARAIDSGTRLLKLLVSRARPLRKAACMSGVAGQGSNLPSA